MKISNRRKPEGIKAGRFYLVASGIGPRPYFLGECARIDNETKTVVLKVIEPLESIAMKGSVLKVPMNDVCLEVDVEEGQKKKDEPMKKTTRGQGWTCPHCDGVTGNRASKCKHCGLPNPGAHQKTPREVGKGPVGRSADMRPKTDVLPSIQKYAEEVELGIGQMSGLLRTLQVEREALDEPASSLSYEIEADSVVLKTDSGGRFKVTKKAAREFIAKFYLDSFGG